MLFWMIYVVSAVVFLKYNFKLRKVPGAWRYRYGTALIVALIPYVNAISAAMALVEWTLRPRNITAA